MKKLQTSDTIEIIIWSYKTKEEQDKLKKVFKSAMQ